MTTERFSTSTLAGATPAVQTSSGMLSGSTYSTKVGSVHVFKGIPYARAPVGEFRFLAPDPPDAWRGVREANTYSPVSPQSISSIDRILGSKPLPMDEDCLSLNIWTSGLDDARRPVMVWIHGGSFLSGSGRAPWYDGSSFASKSDVVVVTLNYRLGALGFLSLGFLDERFDASCNSGLLDQVAALKWIRENIACFGGDPHNVTVFGESAGAMSVAALLVTSPAKDLFQKAICQSGAPDQVIDEDAAQAVTLQLLATLEIDANANAVGKLAALPVEAILDAQVNVRREHRDTGMPWRPVIDGSIIADEPYKEIQRGTASGVPLLVGTNLDEMRFFTLFDPAVNELDEQSLVDHVKNRYSKSRGDDIVAKYRSSRPGLTAPQCWAATETDRVFRIPSVKLADLQSEHQESTFSYMFTWAAPTFGGSLGASHVLEIPFVFDNLHQPGVKGLCGEVTTKMRELAANMRTSWAEFARTGDPGHAGVPTWPSHTTTRRDTMIFDESCSTELNPGGEARELLSEVLATNHG